MKYTVLLFIWLGAFITSPADAQQKINWKPLFGQTLSDADYERSAWQEANGILTAYEDSPIWTNEEYENFELDLEFKTEEATNSGIIIYCSDPENWIPNSIEIQIADDHYDKSAETQPYQRCGAIYGHLGPREVKVVKQPGEWNHLRARCTGQRISVILNGKKVIEMDMSKWTSGTINPDGSEIPEWLPTPLSEMPTKGYIGLQGKHGEGRISFRNIKIREVR